MRKSILSIALISAIGALGLAGCDVKKTQEGNVTMPKYEVNKTQQGSVTPPKYDVTTPDVKVGSAEKQVTVPKVTTENREITVPTVEVTPAEEKAKQKEDVAAAKK
jgi:hypothetical protein